MSEPRGVTGGAGISGATGVASVAKVAKVARVAGVMGWPVQHSLSPKMHQAAYRAAGINATYVHLPVKPERIGEAVRGIGALGLVGASVTVPHKEAVIPHLDSISKTAAMLRSVNCIVNENGALHGESTDGEGFVRAVAHAFGMPVKDLSVGVLGAGGAARAIVGVLVQAEATEVRVVNRTPSRAQALVDEHPDTVRLAEVRELSEVELVVNATSIGMGDNNSSPISGDVFRGGQCVMDIVYAPEQTRFLADAERAGARTCNGIAMLVFQAVRQIELWFGETPDVQVMFDAVQS